MILAGMLLLTVAGPGTACSLLDEQYSAQYLQYDRHGRAARTYADESDERVWLRLRNNTTCPIRIAAGFRFAIRRLPDSSTTIDPVDGQEVGMEVEVTDRR